MTSTTQARPIAELPIVDQNIALLDALFTPCRDRSVARLIIGRGSAASTILMRPPFELLPPRLLEELAFRTPDDLCLALVSSTADGRLRDMTAVWTEFTLLPRIFQKSRWITSPARLEAVGSALAGFGLAPSFAMDQRASVVAVWLLETPAPLNEPDTFERVQQLQQLLAERLGGRTETERVARPGQNSNIGKTDYASMPAWDLRRPVVRLPGSMNHSTEGLGLAVRLMDAALDRRYPLSALEQACDDTTTRSNT